MNTRTASPTKWYFAANLNALINAFDQIQGAVLSARQVTNLQPVCLIDDHDDPDQVADRLGWLVAAGVSVVPHKAELFAIVRQHFGRQADVFSGHWLRCDIPILETETEFALYTDIDVVFRKPFDLGALQPGFLACAPEQWQEDLRYFNSGVMVMNLPALRATRGQFIDALKSRLASMQPHDDQGVFNLIYRNCWTRLPNQYNWKPYWGYADDARIVHFHGPKPNEARRMLAGDHASFGAEYQAIFLRDPKGYAQYLAEFDRVLQASDYKPCTVDRSAEDWLRAENGELSLLLGAGWSGAEPWGIWGEGEVHSLNITFGDQTASEHEIEIDFDVHVPLFPTRPRQIVDIVVNGRPVAIWRFTEANNRSIRTLRLNRADGPETMIEFRPCTVFRVCDLDPNNPDLRALGVALHGVRLRTPDAIGQLALDSPAHII